MKKLPILIDKCEDCPFCQVVNIKGRLKCGHVFPDDMKGVRMISLDEPIPDWCPLPDDYIMANAIKQLDAAFTKLENIHEKRDIVCDYIRRNK